MAQGLRRDGQELSGMPTDKLVQRAPHVRFVVQADELLTAFVELESVIRAAERPRGLQSAYNKAGQLSRESSKSLLDYVIRQLRRIFGTAE